MEDQSRRLVLCIPNYIIPIKPYTPQNQRNNINIRIRTSANYAIPPISKRNSCTKRTSYGHENPNIAGLGAHDQGVKLIFRIVMTNWAPDRNIYTTILQCLHGEKTIGQNSPDEISNFRMNLQLPNLQPIDTRRERCWHSVCCQQFIATLYSISSLTVITPHPAIITLSAFFGQGHLNPCVELCKYLSPYAKSRIILIIPSHLSSSIPSALQQHHPSIEVLYIEAPPTEGGGNRRDHGHNRDHLHQQLVQGIESFLSERYNNNVPGKNRPGCVVMDFMMSSCRDIFLRENIPILSFFTSGAVSTAMEHAAWKAKANDMKPGETRLLTGLPDCVALRYSDTRRRDHRGPHGVSESDHRIPGGRHGFGHREPGQAPRWLEEGDDFKGLLINTCHDLEGPFLDYLANQVDTPVFGIGPLLPETYWRSTETFCRDRDSRSSNRKSNYTEDEVIQWLDSKPSQSVIYISFGSEVGPTMEEYGQLADALEESRWAFIWVIQPGSGKTRPPPPQSGDKPSTPNDEDEGYNYKPIGLQEKVGKRGMIIMGWAPQLLILSHPSTGGFLSHCGWNSSVEAIGRGVPILAWPIRGDQFYIARLLVDYLKIGVMVRSDDNSSEMAKKSDILVGMDRVMDDKEAHERAKNLSHMFEAGLPSTSKASIKALIQLL